MKKNFPSWYDPNRTVKEMKQISGKTESQIRAYIKFYNLPYKKVRIKEEQSLEFYDPNLTIREMSDKSGISYSIIRNVLIKNNLPYVRSNKVPFNLAVNYDKHEEPEKTIENKNTPEWYNPSLTMLEMAEANGIPYNHVAYVIRKQGLPFKRKTKYNGFEWYDPSLTAQEMADKAGDNIDHIRSLLHTHHLSYKKVVMRKITDIPTWYDPSLSLREMAAKAGVTGERVRQILTNRGLLEKFKEEKDEIKKNLALDIKALYEAGWPIRYISNMLNITKYTLTSLNMKYNLIPLNKKYDVEGTQDQWYDPNLTIPEMAKISGISTSRLFSYLTQNNLPYKRIRIVRNSDLPWYDENLTVQEMADIAGVSTANVYQLLNYRNLPYKRKMSPKYQKGSEGLPWYNPDLTVNEMAEICGNKPGNVRRLLDHRRLPFKRVRKSSVK